VPKNQRKIKFHCQSLYMANILQKTKEKKNAGGNELKTASPGGLIQHELLQELFWCRHRRKNYLIFLLFVLFNFSLIPTPIWRVLCVISISFPFRDMSCVCVWELVYVCACEHKFGVATNHGKFKV
jgi:hypothetical protein